MFRPRRSLKIISIAAVILLSTGSSVTPQSHPTPPPIVPRPSPNAPNPNYPPGLQGPEQTPPDAKKLDRQNQAEIKADVQKLYELIGELREQVERSDTNSTLSLSVVKKAQQIEKLAKQVKDRAKG
ncbi:MAG TPA: hypothetical protein VK818_15045 [Methylomirabilota bacterium]|jgi:hypothetical protein|nr:hypothetical protein [Methylomirabilota bacterium]